LDRRPHLRRQRHRCRNSPGAAHESLRQRGVRPAPCKGDAGAQLPGPVVGTAAPPCWACAEWRQDGTPLPVAARAAQNEWESSGKRQRSLLTSLPSQPRGGAACGTRSASSVALFVTASVWSAAASAGEGRWVPAGAWAAVLTVGVVDTAGAGAAAFTA